MNTLGPILTLMEFNFEQAISSNITQVIISSLQYSALKTLNSSAFNFFSNASQVFLSCGWRVSKGMSGKSNLMAMNSLPLLEYSSRINDLSSVLSNG